MWWSLWYHPKVLQASMLSVIMGVNITSYILSTHCSLLNVIMEVIIIMNTLPMYSITIT